MNQHASLMNASINVRPLVV